MMVPRTSAHPPVPSGRTTHLDEKDPRRTSIQLQDKPARLKHDTSPPQGPIRAISDPSGTVSSTPVKIPSRRGTRPVLGSTSSLPEPANAVPTPDLALDTGRTLPSVGDSVRTLLATTAIPPRRKPKGEKLQRLPDCDHVADFSKLLLDDVKNIDDGLVVGSLGNPQFDGLFGHLNEVVEAPLNLEIEGAAGSLFSGRSVSSDSMPSLADDSTTTSYTEVTSPSPSMRKSTPDRRIRALSTSEDCAEDHPLLYTDLFTPLSPFSIEPPEMIRISPSPQNRPTPKSHSSSFRSNLTASLRALKSAAQTVSNLASTPPILSPDDFLTRSIFSFAPELTDDRRPPPSDNPPSPALRRYLNPPPAPSCSPSEFHSWHEYPSHPTKSKKKGKRHEKSTSALLPAIQLQTCIPSSIRSPTASSPPIWLSSDGSPTANSNPLTFLPPPNLARQREPRENSDFLRILVAEMNMRRSGKFSDDFESHACVWLPARKSGEKPALAGKDRWAVLAAS